MWVLHRNALFSMLPVSRLGHRWLWMRGSSAVVRSRLDSSLSLGGCRLYTLSLCLRSAKTCGRSLCNHSHGLCSWQNAPISLSALSTTSTASALHVRASSTPTSLSLEPFSSPAQFSSSASSHTPSPSPRPTSSPSSSAAATESPPSPSRPWYLRLLSRITPSVDRYQHALNLLRSCNAQAAHPHFVRYCGIGDDVNHSLAMCVLHVWICKQRLVLEPGGKPVLRGLFSSLLSSAEQRMSVDGMQSMVIARNIRDGQHLLYGACRAYDAGLAAARKGHGDQAFMGALYRNLYGGAEQEHDFSQQHTQEQLRPHLERMVAYAKREIDSVVRCDYPNLLEGKHVWGSPPDSSPPSHSPEVVQEHALPVGELHKPLYK